MNEKEKRTKQLLEVFSQLDVNAQAIIFTSANCLLARQEMEQNEQNEKAS